MVSRRIDTPDSRPALAWVVGLPRGWTTSNERLVLFALAADSYDGLACSPNRDAILHATGLWGDAYYRALNGLRAPTDKRPALLSVQRRNGARTVYTFLPTQSENPDSLTPSENPDPVQETNPVGEPRSGWGVETQSEHPVGQPSRSTQSENPDAHPSLPLPLGREGGREPRPPQAGQRGSLTTERVRAVAETVVPPAARAGIDCSNPDLADALAQAFANGWTTDHLAAALADMSRARSSATGQLLARVKALAAREPDALVLIPPAAGNQKPGKPHDVSHPPNVHDLPDYNAGDCEHGAPLTMPCIDCRIEREAANA